MARFCALLALALLIAAAAFPDVASTPAAAKKASSRQAPAADSSGDGAAEQGAAKKKTANPAEIEKQLDAIERSLEDKSDHAVQQLTGLLASTRLPPRFMARALYLRGSAYRKQGKPAQAIADLTSALWLKGGLGDADRKIALAARAQAYREAGLTELAEADAKKSGKPLAEPAARQAQAAQPRSESVPRESTPQVASERKAATASEANPASQSGGLAGFFSNLFGGQAAAPPRSGSASASAGASRADPYVAPGQSRQVAIGEAWTTSAEIERSANSQRPAAARREAPIKTATVKPEAATRAEGGYRLQVAAMRSRKEAQALVARLKKSHAALLGPREPEVDESVLGNMGTFYLVRIGPFADAGQPSALCPQMRGLGLDCLVVTD